MSDPEWMTPEMARRVMRYLTIDAMNADLLRPGSPVQSTLRRAQIRTVRRWRGPDVEQHRAPCSHTLTATPCASCRADAVDTETTRQRGAVR